MCLWLHLWYNMRRMFIRDRCGANGRWWGLLFDALPHVGIQKHISMKCLRAKGALLTRRIMALLVAIISGVYVEAFVTCRALISI